MLDQIWQVLSNFLRGLALSPELIQSHEHIALREFINSHFSQYKNAVPASLNQ